MQNNKNRGHKTTSNFQLYTVSILSSFLPHHFIKSQHLLQEEHTQLKQKAAFIFGLFFLPKKQETMTYRAGYFHLPIQFNVNTIGLVIILYCFQIHYRVPTCQVFHTLQDNQSFATVFVEKGFVRWMQTILLQYISGPDINKENAV